MFTNTINPILLKIGIFEIRYYGIIYALGFIITYFFLRKYIKKGKLKSINKESLDDLVLYLLIGIIVGARVLNFVFYNPSVFWTDPLEILKIWHGGLSFHGGLIGGLFSMIAFTIKHKLKLIAIADAIVVPASLALTLGRLANFTNHELYGTITNIPWCVNFINVIGCRHPYQIYAAITHIIMFIILLKIYNKQKKEGTSFWSFMIIYGSFRILTDFFKEETKLIYGIGMGQILSLIMVLMATIVLIKRKKKLHTYQYHK